MARLNLLPTAYDIDVARGAHINILFPVQNENNVDVDLTGWTVSSGAKNSADGTETAFAVAIEGSGVRLTVDDSVTAVLGALSTWDIWLRNNAQDYTVAIVAGVVRVAERSTPIA